MNQIEMDGIRDWHRRTGGNHGGNHATTQGDPRWNLCLHEAAHAIVDAAVGRDVSIIEALDNRGSVSGSFLYCHTPEERMISVATLMAGQVAEEMFGTPDGYRNAGGPGSDAERVEELTYALPNPEEFKERARVKATGILGRHYTDFLNLANELYRDRVVLGNQSAALQSVRIVALRSQQNSDEMLRTWGRRVRFVCYGGGQVGVEDDM